ncbi:hypothetical protein MHLP_03085 [Candidatus Mycoplasma haematolamae str. Purdue]|uniref:Uncharacterized protein n=1 Tax=Mycoplasma haematolamae (strain Purdue) TaxID=1212765 RepID=I7C6P2_MYCHA|nr:hypothetical protein MHLP_03085 [Candidatus Mycoplasma haematolamae str. Purdue]
MTAGGVSGVACSSLGSSGEAALHSQAPRVKVQEGQKGPSQEVQMPSAIIKNATSVSPIRSEPEPNKVTYKFTNGRTASELTCTNGLYPGAGYDSSRNVILCQEDNRRDFFGWIAIGKAQPSKCEWNSLTQGYQCSSKGKKLNTVMLKGSPRIKTRTALQIS